LVHAGHWRSPAIVVRKKLATSPPDDRGGRGAAEDGHDEQADPSHTEAEEDRVDEGTEEAG
jgi:hypothetical protein